jgi:hypothetical protein
MKVPRTDTILRCLKTSDTPLPKVSSDHKTSADMKLAHCSQLEKDSDAKAQQLETLSNHNVQPSDSECGQNSTDISRVENSRSVKACGVADESQPPTASQHITTEPQMSAKSPPVTDDRVSGEEEAVAAPLPGLTTSNSRVPENPIEGDRTTTGTTFANPNSNKSNPKLTPSLEPAKPKGKRKADELDESHKLSNKRQKCLDPVQEYLTNYNPAAKKSGKTGRASRP